MKIVFLSNYYNHHQSAFAELMYKVLNNNFYFISCEEVDAERITMGWTTDNIPSFVHRYNDDSEHYDKLINNSDVVIHGSAPYNLIFKRINEHKFTLLYTERIDKKQHNIISFWKSFIGYNLRYKYKSEVYCLCASAFTSYDFSKRMLFKDKCYKWGYFPKVIRYDNINDVLESKQSEAVSILFVSRLIGWKHPELPVKVAKKLKAEGVSFHLTMIGIGDMEDMVHGMIEKYGLLNNITHIKSMSPEKVRTYMEKSSIFLFTSDRNEGWGAVLNEAMNSGCAVVASSEIGAVPYLLHDGKNGYIYQDGNFADLYNKVKNLCLNKKKREQFGIEAYYTMINIWNAENATGRLIELIKDLMVKGRSERFSDGPCSSARIIKDGWYKI